MKKLSLGAVREKQKGDVAKSKTSRILGKAALYTTLITFGFVFLYPILVIISNSSKDVYDLSNSVVKWIPTKITFENYTKAFTVLGGMSTVLTSVVVMLLISLVQTASSAIIAYGFAKYEFWCKKLIFALMIATFILPQQVTFLPKYVMFNNYHMLNTALPILIPSLLGQGIKNTIFILIFYQFFRMSPKSLDEAASVDGASGIRIFATINMRMATPAIVVVFIFSFVWNWNETYLTASYFGAALTTLPLALKNFKEYYEKMFPANSGQNPLLKLNEGIIMAATLLTVLPLIAAYVLVERKLIESIDKSGITGE